MKSTSPTLKRGNRLRGNPPTLKHALVGGLASLTLLTANVASAQTTYTDIHDFGLKVDGPTGLPQQDGFLEDSGVTFDSSGNMYGTTQIGGTGNGSVLWEITAGGVYLVLHDFGGTILNANGKVGPDGYQVTNGVTFDAAGNLYGVANAGGAYQGGILWELSKGGVYTDLHDFGGTVKNANGVFGPDGNFLRSRVTPDNQGNLYGTTLFGGPTATSLTFGDGMLWKLSSGGGPVLYQDLHDFGGTVINANGQSGPDGEGPNSVTLDSMGNLYGTAGNGGPINSTGMVWKFTASGSYYDLHDFGGLITNASGTTGADGEFPFGTPIFDSAGNMYGTTYICGAPSVFPHNGNVWEITKAGAYLDLWDFGGSNAANVGGRSGPDGFESQATVALDQYGNLYGTTFSGGQNPYVYGGGGGGIVWTIGSFKGLGLSTSTVAAGNKVTGTITLGRPAPIGGTMINLSSSDPSAEPPATVKVQPGQTTTTFTIVTGRVTSATAPVISATQGNTTFAVPLAVQPVTVSGFSYFNGPFGGTSETINIDLDGPAPASGLTITLSSSSPDAQIPPTVFIAAGATSKSFTVTYSSVTTNTPVTITGTLGSVMVPANIVIKP